MKKIYKLLLGVLCLASFFSITHFPQVAAADDADTGSRVINVTVTEQIPGLECEGEGELNADGDYEKYECPVPLGLKGVFLFMGAMIRWFTGFALLCAVLYLVFNGIHLSAGGIDGNAKGEVKKRILMTIGGIILLLLSGPFLKILAPWIYK